MKDKNKCLSVEFEWGGQRCIVLIDTGCRINLVYRRASEKMEVKNEVF